MSDILSTKRPGKINGDINARNLRNVYMFPLKDDSKKYICYGYFIAVIRIAKENYLGDNDELNKLEEGLNIYLTSEILPIINKENKFGMNITLNEIKIYDFIVKYEDKRYILQGHIYFDDIKKLNTGLDKKLETKIPEDMAKTINGYLIPQK